MARYLVISNETNSIVTVIDWDGVTPLFENMENAPNYRYELETDFSYTYELNFTSSSDIMTLEPVYAGKFNGFFDGTITPNTIINGRPIYQIPKDTEYGRMYYQGTTNDFFDKLDSDTQLSSSFFAFDNEVNTSEIYLTLTNNDDFKIHNYSSSLSRILTDSLSNFVFKLQSDQDTSFMEYFVSNAELSSSLSGKKYVKLSVSQSSEYINNDFKRNSDVDYDLLLGTDWNIDFDFGDKTQVGKFYGDFNGTIGGEKLEDILSLPPKCSALTYETEIFTQIPTPNIKNIPKLNSFRFDKDASSDWNNVSPTMVRIHSNSTISNVYKNLLGRFISEGLEGSTIKFSFHNPMGIRIEKTFLMLDGYYVERDAQSNVIKFYRQDWSTSTKYEINDTYNEFDVNLYPPTSINDGYYNIRIQQVDTNTSVDPYPLYDYDTRPFDVCITLASPRKKIEVFEFKKSNTKWSVPAWANKITIYSIGAGGGGGGGSAAWGHSNSVPTSFVEEGEYHTIGDIIGFEWATGGSGGAGGNLAITELIVDQIGDKILPDNIGKQFIPANSELSILVGSGGLGGRGLTNNSNDYVLIDKKSVFDLLTPFTPLNPAAITSKTLWMSTILNNDFKIKNWYFSISNSDNSVITTDYEYWSENLNNNWNVDQFRRLQVGNTETMGKSGGYSNVTLKSVSNKLTNMDVELIHASGGNGGLNGVALNSLFPIEHRICEIFDVNDFLPYTHNVFPTLVPGGGSSLKNSFGNVSVNIGGYGGFGISMPVMIQEMQIVNTRRSALDYLKFDKISDVTEKKNVAPDIPWTNNSLTRKNLKLPNGSLYDLKQNETYEEHGWKKYTNQSYETPNKIAPLGGNGGVGASYSVLYDVPPPNDIISITAKSKFELENNTPQLGIPYDWFYINSRRALEKVEYGDNYRPMIVNNAPIISINPTRVNGNIYSGPYTFKLADFGALGGFDTYKLVSGADAIPSSIPPQIAVKTSPENGLDYGQGGGGGAAAYTTNWEYREIPIQGQNGGNGANGIVIIVVE